MKRKGRKSKGATSDANGVEEKPDQNGQASDQEAEIEEPEDKKKKGGKKPKPASPKKPTDEEPEEEEAYEVQQILDEKNIRGVRHFLIRWKGYEPESDTWEPESTLNCPEIIADFKSKQEKKKGRPAKTKKGDDTEETWDENEDFEVDRILEVHFKKNGKREFLVSWKGYPSSQNTWEPEENMDCKDLIEKFMSKVEKAKDTTERELRVNRMHTDRFTLSTSDSGRRLSKRNQGKQRVHYHDAE